MFKHHSNGERYSRWERWAIRFLTINLIIFLSLVVVRVCFAKRYQPDTESRGGPTIRVTAKNPTIFSLGIESKCDHDHTTGKYKYYRLLYIPRGSSIVIDVPVNMKNCEIWGRIGRFDE